MSNSSQFDEGPLQADVRRRFGVLPNFFRLAPDAPEITENFWGFAKFAYLDNPLPPVFKERLFVYLSRFCEVQYCLARHVGFLIGLGKPAGAAVAPESLEEVVRLIQRPLATGDSLKPLMDLLEAGDATIGSAADIPESGSQLEEAVFACATHVYLQSPEASRCLAALRRAFDESLLQHLLTLTAFVRTAHFWTQVHPELTLENDVLQLLQVQESLAACVRTDTGVPSETRQTLMAELESLRKEVAQTELLQVTLASIGDAVLTTDAAGRVQFLNDVAEGLTGWTTDAAAGQPVNRVFDIVNEQTGEKVESPVDRVLREGVTVGLANHTILIAKDGTRRPIDDSGSPIRVGDAIVGVVLVFRDVTDRRKNERALAESEARKTAIFETALDCIISMDQQGRVIEINAAAERTFGFRREEAIGRDLAELIVPLALRDGHRAGLAHFLATGEGPLLGQRIEMPAIRADGSELTVELAVTAVHVDGEPCFTAYLRDVTEKKELEKAKAEQQRLVALRADVGTALASSGDVENALQQCSESLVVHLDAAFARIWVLDEKDETLVLKASAGQYTHLDGPHSRIRVGQYKIGRIAGNKSPHLTNDVANDPTISDADWAEKEGMVAFAGYPLTIDDRVLGVLALFARTRLSETIIADLLAITDSIAQFLNRRRAEAALRESEVRYRLVGRAANDAIWDWNLLDNEVTWNEGIQSRFGYTPDEIGHDATWWYDHIHPDDQGRVVDGIHKVIDDDGITWSDEYRFRRSDGSYAVVSDQGQVVRDEQGKPLRMVGAMLDLTERMQAERLIQESEERVRMAVESADIGTWDYDLVGGELKWSNRCKAIFGLAPEADIDYEVFLQRLHPDDRDRTHAAVQSALDTSGPGRYEIDYRSLWPDGTVRWVIAKGQAFFENQNGTRKAIRFAGTVLDITERKQAEEQLRASEARFRQIADTMPQIVWGTRPDGYHEYYNHRWYEFVGCTPEECVGYKWSRFVHADDRQISAERWRYALETGEPYEIECRLRGSDGVYRWHLARALAVRDESGQIVQWFGTCTDIEDVKRSEEATRKRSDQVRRLADVASRIGVAHDVRSVLGIVTEEARYVIECRQSMASFGMEGKPAENTMSVSLSEAYAQWTEADASAFSTGVERAVCELNTSVRLTHDELMKHAAGNRGDGQERQRAPMRGCLIAPLVGRDGRNFGYIQLSDRVEGEFTADDEAILVQLAQMASVAIENARLVQSLRDADRNKDEFLATLAHELRNPLAPIRMGLELMKFSSDDAALLEETRSTMERQTHQLITLVDDLMDVSRITRGKLELRKSRVKLADVVQSAVEASRPAIDEAGHELQVSLPDDEIVLEADPNRLAQIVSNILNNAARYTPEGGRIELAVEQRDDEVVISVSDNGIGISAENLEQIFEMFAQGNAVKDKGYAGLGIGLTLVKSLVSMHGGEVEVSSDGVDRGSEFRIRLPLAEQTPRESSEPDETAPSSTPAVKRRVLIVDDNRPAAEMLSRVVRILGNEVRTAHDGEEAIGVAAEFKPDVTLMDLGMPRMDGYEAATHFRSQPWGADMVLIALTGWGQEEDKRRSKEAGFDYHLTKPAEPAELQRLFTEARRPAST